MVYKYKNAVTQKRADSAQHQFTGEKWHMGIRNEPETTNPGAAKTASACLAWLGTELGGERQEKMRLTQEKKGEVLAGQGNGARRHLLAASGGPRGWYIPGEVVPSGAQDLAVNYL